jgi:hypothetical protein
MMAEVYRKQPAQDREVRARAAIERVDSAIGPISCPASFLAASNSAWRLRGP